MYDVGHFLNDLNRGGTPGMVISLMRRSKFKHVYVTFNAIEERKKEFEEFGLDLIEVPDIMSAIKFMKKNVKIVHAQNSGGPEPGVHIGVESGKPVIETCQSPSLPAGSMFEQVHVVPVSAGILQYWPDDIRYDRVIYSCAEPVQSVSGGNAWSKEYFEFNRTDTVIGRVGRLEGIKRPWDFVRTAIEIHKLAPRMKFLLVGDGSDGEGVRYEARQALEQHGVEICMPGYLTGIMKDKAYNAIDLFLYPTSMEGFGISFAEAMSIGLPIVTYSDPVNVDIVGSAGVFATDNLFYNVANPWSALANLTLDLLINRREYKKLSDRALKLYEKRYRPERMAEEYDKLYEELLSG